MVVFSKHAAGLAAYVAGLAAASIAIRAYGDRSSTSDTRVKKLFVEGAQSKKGDKVAVDRVFAKRVWRLLKIMCPGLLTPEFGFAVLVACALVRDSRFAMPGGCRGPSVLLPSSPSPPQSDAFV